MLIASFSLIVKQVPVDISTGAITELQQHLLNRCLQKYLWDGSSDSKTDTGITSWKPVIWI
jgi:hypothetical protein